MLLVSRNPGSNEMATPSFPTGSSDLLPARQCNHPNCSSVLTDGRRKYCTTAHRLDAKLLREMASIPPTAPVPAGHCAEWPPEPEQESVQDVVAEIAQGWDSMCPRRVQREGWDMLPDDVQEHLATIIGADTSVQMLTLEASLGKKLRKRRVGQLCGLCDRLLSVITDLWHREAKSLLLGPDGSLIGVAEYRAVRHALNTIRTISTRLGSKTATVSAEAMDLYVSSLDKDELAFIEIAKAQLEAGDVDDTCTNLQ